MQILIEEKQIKYRILLLATLFLVNVVVTYFPLRMLAHVSYSSGTAQLAPRAPHRALDEAQHRHDELHELKRSRDIAAQVACVYA